MNTGGRKLRADRETGWLLILAFLLWLVSYYLAKTPTEALFFILGALVGKFGAFTWGNVGEHKAKAQTKEGNDVG